MGGLNGDPRQGCRHRYAIVIEPSVLLETTSFHEIDAGNAHE